MEKIIEFFKTSPLSWWEKIIVLLIGTSIFLVFIIGGIYLAFNEPKNFGFLYPIIVSVLIFFATLYIINPQKVAKWIGAADKEWSSGNVDKE